MTNTEIAELLEELADMYCGGYIDGVFSKCDHHGNGHLDCCPVSRALAAAKKLREGKVAVVSDPEMASYLSDWGEIVCRMSLDLGRERSFARRRKAMTVGETCLYCGGSGKTGSEARCQRTWDSRRHACRPYFRGRLR